MPASSCVISTQRLEIDSLLAEWVQDCWHGTYAGAPSDGRAWEEGDCGRRAIRGGSWYGKPSYVRTANRFWYDTYFRNNNLGFRIARSLQE